MTTPTPPFSVAFQPIVDVETGITVAQEALVRGPQGEPAESVLSAIAQGDRYGVDTEIRRMAVAEALRLGLPATGASLMLNVYPGCIGRRGCCIVRTLEDAEALGFPTNRLVFEISETEPVEHPEELAAELVQLQRRGVRIALDDIGTGHARLPLLRAWRPDGAKVARELMVGLDRDPAQRARLAATLAELRGFGLAPVVEGIETMGELAALRALGVREMQGFLFARPAVGQLPVPLVPKG